MVADTRVPSLAVPATFLVLSVASFQVPSAAFSAALAVTRASIANWATTCLVLRKHHTARRRRLSLLLSGQTSNLTSLLMRARDTSLLQSTAMQFQLEATDGHMASTLAARVQSLAMLCRQTTSRVMRTMVLRLALMVHLPLTSHHRVVTEPTTRADHTTRMTKATREVVEGSGAAVLTQLGRCLCEYEESRGCQGLGADFHHAHGIPCLT